MSVPMWPFRSKPALAPAPRRRSIFSTTEGDPEDRRSTQEIVHGAIAPLMARLPSVTVAGTTDSGDGTLSLKQRWAASSSELPIALVAWYASQTFIGHQLCALIAQHWLVDKACTMPARDAIRQGWRIVNGTGEKIDPDIVRAIGAADRKYRLAHNMEQFVRMGRIFGIRVVLFKVESTDPSYYEKPFNPDGVTPGSYRGMVQIDPYWIAPELDADAASNPASVHFFEPTWWIINGKRHHRTHLAIFRTSEVADILKPAYLYGGIPLPQKIMERIYAAERTANEAPQLAMTKRLGVWKTDLAELAGNQQQFADHMENFIRWRDNYGQRIIDTEDDMQQFDTTLSDLDDVIMTQYQLVASIANVPATKLLGTSPKGFNATGEYEESSYHEELETIQMNDLTPLMERHHLLVMRSDIARQFGKDKLFDITVDWEPLDSPTAKEYAEINLIEAQTDAQLVQAGAIDGFDVRARIAKDLHSGYTDLPDPEPEDEPDDEDLANGEE